MQRYSGLEGIGTYGWGAAHGDSGGMVFVYGINGDTTQARGIVSHCPPSTACHDGQTDFEWTEAPDILNAFGLKLNPQT